MKNNLLGPLTGQIERHLQLRHSLGFVLKNAQYTLSDFDQYMAKHFPEVKTITRPLILSYLETIKHLQPQSQADRLVHLRQFCRFLSHIDPTTYIPEQNLLPSPKTAIKPHIYRMSEVTDLLRVAGRLCPSDSLRPHTYRTVIGLLWATGLRIGEALRLNIEDVDLVHGVLTVRQTKNFKSRLIPLTLSTTDALSAYRERRSQHGHDQHSTAAFFVNERGRRCNRNTVEKTFLSMTRQTGLKSAQGRSPRLHDFRHTFATRCLSEFYESGKDPTAYLPVLATYLGHTHLTDTEIYLHPQPAVLEMAGQRFGSHVRTEHLLIRRSMHEHS